MADDRFNYILLSRLQCDCEYYLGLATAMHITPFGRAMSRNKSIKTGII